MGKIGIAFLFVLTVAFLAPAQDYDGPIPDKADIPFLLHAHNLIETEAGEARMEERKNETANILDGASSPVRTPLAEPIFIYKSGEIPVNKLSLWKVETVKGTREIAFPKDQRKARRNGPFPVHTIVRKVGEDVYWIEANEYLENGQYCLSPDGSQKVFCFEIY